MLTDGDFCVRLAQLPGSIKAFITFDESGYFSIYINSRLPAETQRRALKHELRHIRHDDFFNGKPIIEVENE